jgi:hypothetical protein
MCSFLATRFHNRFNHLLYEQRNAIGALDDFLSNASRQGLVTRDAVDHSDDFAVVEPIDAD